MNLNQRINAFVKLGNYLGGFVRIINGLSSEDIENELPEEYVKLNYAVNTCFHYNSWFDKKNVLSSIKAISDTLNERSLYGWINKYDSELYESKNPKKVGVVMAGNIPLVGFHDLICILISGNILYAKQSSSDKILLPEICNLLIEIESGFKNFIDFTDAPFKNPDAVIATGSNNTARYFEYYFGKYPHIIRKNRNSVAVVNGKENIMELKSLGSDIFQYFGLGCRSVSKLMVPDNYDFNHFFGGIFEFENVAINNKYGNNYDYHKTVYLLNNESLLENGFLIIKEDKSLHSPPACLFYEYYKNENQLIERLIEDKDKIQCAVSMSETPTALKNNGIHYLPFGKAQYPNLSDYADGVDTMAFLAGLNK